MNTKPAHELERGDVISLFYPVPDHPTATTSQSVIVAKATRTDDLIVTVLVGPNGGRLVDAWEPEEEVSLGVWE